MELNIIDIIILLIISIIIGIIIGTKINCNSENFTETLINTNNTRKQSLSTCCENNKCYDKPPYLQPEQCETNKADAVKQIDTIFTPQYTKEEYEKKIKDLDLENNKINMTKDIEYNSKINEKITVKNLDSDTYNKIINDNNIINGNESKEYAPYKKTK